MKAMSPEHPRSLHHDTDKGDGDHSEAATLPNSSSHAGSSSLAAATTTTASSSSSSTGTGGDADSNRPMFNRLSTMPDHRVLDDPDIKNRPLSQWTIPRSRAGKSPRAATLFLGQDHERWRMQDRDNMGAGMKIAWAWRAGSSSALPDATSTAESFFSGEDDEDDDYESADYTDTFTDDESEGARSSSRLSRRSSRSSQRSRSGSGVWKKPAIHALTAATGGYHHNHHHHHHPTVAELLDSTTSSSGASSIIESGASSSQGSSIGTIARKPRRFSSNGPEAAFLRHETVIGIHTPRRDSASSSTLSIIGRQLPTSIERVTLAPLSQIKTGTSSPVSIVPSGSPSKVQFPTSLLPPQLQQQEQERQRQQSQEKQDSPISSTASKPKHDLSSSPSSSERHKLHREMSSSNMLKKAAALAAAASLPPSPDIGEQEGRSEGSPLSTKGTKNSSTPPTRLTSEAASRSGSPAPTVFRLARRRKAITVEGTLYDRTGPFREGAVTDGLSVRLFSAENEKDEEGWANSDDDRKDQNAPVRNGRHRSRRRSRRDKNRRQSDRDGRDAVTGESRGEDGKEEEDEGEEEGDIPAYPLVNKSPAATTYLITTPDNRVSSAAKLRRWAMDGSGRFYAAMEIKSVEAKIRSAMDPNEARENAAYARSLAKILRSTYLDDILNEIQKAETLNPGRTAVAKLLVTGDGKYIRLEEDYPEEAFFVIAGCEDEELYPVVALVFAQALGHIHRFHQAGWLHGDIKLENLMFDSQGDLVVIDYENANPFRTVGGDGCVNLMSFDWVPPEASGSECDGGRRVGPSADLWALGANLVRAFALRDGIDDASIRRFILQEQGQKAFLSFRDSLIQVDEGKQRATSADVDLSAILDCQDDVWERKGPGLGDSEGDHMTPARLLLPFAISAPHLLKYVLASCLVLSPSSRGLEAELEGLRLAEELQKEKKGEVMKLGQRAVRTAIELSGSEWVRPKLEEARRSLGLGDDEGQVVEG